MKWIDGKYNFTYLMFGQLKIAHVDWGSTPGEATVYVPVHRTKSHFANMESAKTWAMSQALSDAEKLVEELRKENNKYYLFLDCF